MFSNIFGRTHKPTAQDRAELNQIVAQMSLVLSRVRAGETVDPLRLARMAGLSEAQALAALNILRKSGGGRFEVEVVNRRGQAIAAFPTLADVPPEVDDDYGDRIAVDTNSLRIVFRPSGVRARL